MKNLLLHIAICIVLSANAAIANVYVVFFMTEKGTTGHVGIAIDNYKVLVQESAENGLEQRKLDTISTGSLTFFDLWPEKDVPYGRFNKNTRPWYFQLPRTSAEPKITVESLLYSGLPHRYRHPCDALVQISTTPQQDAELVAFIEQLTQKRPYYNARKYNCADFVRLCLGKVLNKQIKAKEFIPVSWVSTPNKLFKKLKKMPEPVLVLRDPGSKADGSFFVERILKNKS